MIRISQSGRSMVEMLGVLAIIGVLSIGAIAGYSKAMLKYKLNKQADQYTQLLNGVVTYNALFAEADTNTSLVPYYKKLNIVPKEMIKDDSNLLYDIFGLKITIYKVENTNLKQNHVYFQILFTDYDDINNNVCRNIIETAKSAVIDDALSIGINSNSEDGTKKESWYYGNKYCSADNNRSSKCFKHLTVNTIEQLCNRCDKYACGIFAIFNASE